MGFAGLSSMVSEVDDIVAQEISASENMAKQKITVSSETVAPSSISPSTSRPTEQPQTALVLEKPNKTRRNWIIAIVVIAGGYWLANRSDDYSSSTSTVNDTSSVANYSPQVEPPSVQPEQEAILVDEVPPVGTDLILSRAQIRYCLAEGVRLDAARGTLNPQRKSDTKRFNKYVADYNARCSSYRYHRQDLDKATHDVQERQYEYENEGLARFHHSR